MPQPNVGNEFRPLLSVSEASKKLNVGRTLLYDLMAKGALPYVRVGRTRRIMRSTVETFLDRHLIGAVGRHE